MTFDESYRIARGYFAHQLDDPKLSDEERSAVEREVRSEAGIMMALENRKAFLEAQLRPDEALVWMDSLSDYVIVDVPPRSVRSKAHHAG